MTCVTCSLVLVVRVRFAGSRQSPLSTSPVAPARSSPQPVAAPFVPPSASVAVAWPLVGPSLSNATVLSAVEGSLQPADSAAIEMILEQKLKENELFANLQNSRQPTLWPNSTPAGAGAGAGAAIFNGSKHHSPAQSPSHAAALPVSLGPSRPLGSAFQSRPPSGLGAGAGAGFAHPLPPHALITSATISSAQPSILSSVSTNSQAAAPSNASLLSSPYQFGYSSKFAVSSAVSASSTSPTSATGFVAGVRYDLVVEQHSDRMSPSSTDRIGILPCIFALSSAGTAASTVITTSERYGYSSASLFYKDSQSPERLATGAPVSSNPARGFAAAGNSPDRFPAAAVATARPTSISSSPADRIPSANASAAGPGGVGILSQQFGTKKSLSPEGEAPPSTANGIVQQSRPISATTTGAQSPVISSVAALAPSAYAPTSMPSSIQPATGALGPAAVASAPMYRPYSKQSSVDSPLENDNRSSAAVAHTAGAFSTNANAQRSSALHTPLAPLTIGSSSHAHVLPGADTDPTTPTLSAVRRTDSMRPGSQLQQTML